MKLSLFAALCAALLFPGATGLANDASFSGIVGTPTLSGGEHRQIRMESERVVLTLRAGGQYETDARFVFVNDSSQKVAVRMGFPEGGQGDFETDIKEVAPAFLRFATFVGGREVKAKRTLIPHSDDDVSDVSDVWWIKTVTFAPRERKNVRVSALSPVGIDNGYSTQMKIMSYDFTGKNWKGLVARSDLEVRVPFDGLWSVSAAAWSEDGRAPRYFQPSVEVKDGVGILRHSWRNWQAQSYVGIQYQRVMPFWMAARNGSYGYYKDALLEKMVTFRVGPNPGAIGALDANAPNGFVRDGVSFVEFGFLEQRAKAMNENVAVTSSWDKASGATTLQRGALKLSFTPGQRAMKVRDGDAEARTVELRAAPVLVRKGERNALFVPLAQSARALGMKIKVEAARRRFSVG